MKPRIFFARGFWRVTPCPRNKGPLWALWHLAHKFASKRNNDRHAESYKQGLK